MYSHSTIGKLLDTDTIIAHWPDNNIFFDIFTFDFS